MKWTARLSRAARTMLAIVVVVFLVELVVMAVLAYWLGEVWRLRLALLDAGLLALLVAPPVYFLVLRPLRREYERRLEAQRLAHLSHRLAMTDPLTGVLNRRAIKAALLEAMAQADRYRRPLSLAMLDLDDFKLVNDIHGHTAGDEALHLVVRVVQARLRAPDRLGRFGGDEFLILLPETRLPDARALTARISDLLRESEFDVRGLSLTLSASFGEIEFEPGESLESALERVDRALYRAKYSRTTPLKFVAAPARR